MKRKMSEEDMQYRRTADRIRQSNYRIYNNELAHYIGLNESIYLAYLIDQNYYFSDLRNCALDEPFYKQQFYIYFETSLGPQVCQRINKKLVDMGIIEIVKQGLPQKNFFRIDYDKLEELLDESIINFEKVKSDFWEQKKKSTNIEDHLKESGSDCNILQWDRNDSSDTIESNDIINNKEENNKETNFINKISATDEPLQIEQDNNLDIILDLGTPEDNKDILGELDTIPLAPAAPPKRKQGVNIAPYIDACNKYFIPYPGIKKALTNYIIAVNSCRAIWTLDEWIQLLEDLVSKHSMKIPGTEGVKILPTAILKEIELALLGNGKEPYMYFGDYQGDGTSFNLNQDFINS